MPRTARASIGGFVYHTVNRGNARAIVFHDSSDYSQFLSLLRIACERIAMRILGYCLMPNHFHLVLWPYENHDLGRWMHWLLTTHVHRHHARHKTSGRIWQGRFKAFPIQQDSHLLAVLRYVERNAATARLVETAEAWSWGSLRERNGGGPRTQLLAKTPVEMPWDWNELVNLALTAKELLALRTSTGTGRPYGDASWVDQTARDLGLESTLRPRGRPRRRKEECPLFSSGGS
jgi:putative transposase